MREAQAFAPAEQETRKPLESVGPATAQIGGKGMFFLGERFDYAGERGRLCHVPAKYKWHEIFRLNAQFSAIVNPETGEPVAVLRMPDDLWSKEPNKSYYPFDETEIRPVDLEEAFAKKDAKTIKLFANFQYTTREERCGQRAEARSEIKAEQVMERLMELGIVEEKDGFKIWDKEKLREIKIGGPKEGSKYQEGFLGVPGKIYRRHFFELLKKEVGVLKDEYDRAKAISAKALKGLAPHPIFYNPRNLDETFSPEMIKSRVNTIGYWEIGQLVSWGEKMELESGENVGLNEMTLARIIYGDLDGHRGNDGVLYIQGEDGNDAPISANRLLRNVGRFSVQSENAGKSVLTSTPVEYVTKNCPEMRKRGLLLPSDFRATGGWAKEVGSQMSGVIRDGDQVSIDGQVLWIKGWVDPDKQADTRGVKLSNGLYALVERKSDKWEVVATILPHSAEKGHVRKEDVDISRYRITDQNPRFPDESPEHYAERIRQMADYSFVAQTTTEIAAKAETPLKDSLSWREQQWLATALHERPKLKDDVVANTKKFGTDFLRTFLSCEYDTALADKIVSVASSLDAETAKKLFQKYGDITKLAENLDQTLAAMTDKNISPEKRNEIRANILRRARNLLEDAADNPEKHGELVSELGKIHSDTVAFCEVFKSLFKGEAQIDLSELKGLNLETVKIEGLADKDKSEMLAIVKGNWLPRGAAGRGVVEEFEQKLKTGTKTDFYVLRRDGKIISFVRFDEPTPEGHRYAGSFNVDPQYRGSAIGEAMIYNALDKQAEEYVLDATVYPQLDVGTRYVEQTGFFITGVLHNYDNSGETFFEITCDRKRNRNLVSREAKKETLMALATSEGQNWRELIGHNLIVLRFDAEKENDGVLSVTEGLISAGYVGARYFADPSDKRKRYYVFEMDKVEEEKAAVGF